MSPNSAHPRLRLVAAVAVVVLTVITAATAGALAVRATTAKAALPATVVLAASAVRTSLVLTAVQTVHLNHVALPALTARPSAASTVQPVLTHAPISVVSDPLGRKNSAHKVDVLKAVPTAQTVHLLTAATVLLNPDKTVVRLLSAATTVAAMPPVVSVANTVARQLTVVSTATATVVHHTVPSIALTSARKAVVSSHVVISKPAVPHPSALALKPHVVARPRAEKGR